MAQHIMFKMLEKAVSAVKTVCPLPYHYLEDNNKEIITN